MPNCEIYIEEKMASIVNELLKREWPQHWPNFHEIYIKCLQENMFTFDICCRSLKLLSDDCGSSEFSSNLPTARRKEIITGLTQILSGIIEILIKRFDEFFNIYKYKSEEMIVPLNTILLTISSLYEWVYNITLLLYLFYYFYFIDAL